MKARTLEALGPKLDPDVPLKGLWPALDLGLNGHRRNDLGGMTIAKIGSSLNSRPPMVCWLGSLPSSPFFPHSWGHLDSPAGFRLWTQLVPNWEGIQRSQVSGSDSLCHLGK